MNNLIQIGVCAMRDEKTGAFLDAEPVTQEMDDQSAERYNVMMRAAGRMFGEWMGERG